MIGQRIQCHALAAACTHVTQFLAVCCRVDLETRLQELERRKIDDDSKLQAERERMEEKVQAARDAKETAEKEALVLKSVSRYRR